MKLVEFLIHLLEAHAHTLQRLAALMTEESLLELLENAGDDEVASPVLKARPQFARGGHPTGVASAYAEIESAVRGFELPAFLLFHLWAYPHYRALIESATDLEALIPMGDSMGTELVDEAVGEAKLWTRKLSLPPELGARAEKAAEIPWLKFRATLLKRIGKRPLGAV